MVQAVESSLKRLQTDYIDLLWMHIWDGMTPVDEVMRGFDDLIRQGKVLYAGVSDAPAWWVAQANTLAALRGWTPFIALQIEYSLMERTVERELLPMAKALGLGVTAWSPLAGGVLSGKYHAKTEEADSRMSTERMKSFAQPREKTGEVVAALKGVAEQCRRSMAQVALAWLRYREQPVIPILGARRIEQLKDNLASFELDLTPEQVRRLDDASAISLGFPYDFYANAMVRNMVFGGLRDKILI